MYPQPLRIFRAIPVESRTVPVEFLAFSALAVSRSFGSRCTSAFSILPTMKFEVLEKGDEFCSPNALPRSRSQIRFYAALSIRHGPSERTVDSSSLGG